MTELWRCIKLAIVLTVLSTVAANNDGKLFPKYPKAGIEKVLVQPPGPISLPHSITDLFASTRCIFGYGKKTHDPLWDEIQSGGSKKEGFILGAMAPSADTPMELAEITGRAADPLKGTLVCYPDKIDFK
eukprot:g2917.t1